MPRKSTASNISAVDERQDGMSVEDLSLPRTMVQRLAKGVLPANTQIQKDAVLAISKSATVFVNYLTSHAMENAARGNKKTIQPKDVLEALQEIEFEGFIPRCQGELDKYNTIQCDKRNSYRRKIREEAKAKEVQDGSQLLEDSQGDASGLALEGGQTGADSVTARGDDEPAAKRVRNDGVDVEDEDDDETLDEVIEQQEEEAEEDEEEEEDEEVEDEIRPPEDDLMEDLLEERDLDREDEDEEDEVLDGEESD